MRVIITKVVRITKGHEALKISIKIVKRAFDKQAIKHAYSPVYIDYNEH